MLVAAPAVRGLHHRRPRSCWPAASLGRLTLVRVRLAHDGALGDGWLPEHFYDPAATAGGALIDLGCHPMYLARLFLGRDARDRQRVLRPCDRSTPSTTTPSRCCAARTAPSASSRPCFAAARSPFTHRTARHRGRAAVRHARAAAAGQHRRRRGANCPCRRAPARPSSTVRTPCRRGHPRRGEPRPRPRPDPADGSRHCSSPRGTAMTVAVGLIGCGNISRAHVRGYLSVPGPGRDRPPSPTWTPAVAAERAEQAGGARVFTAYRDMLRGPGHRRRRHLPAPPPARRRRSSPPPRPASTSCARSRCASPSTRPSGSPTRYAPRASP